MTASSSDHPVSVCPTQASDGPSPFDQQGQLGDRACGVPCPDCSAELVIGQLDGCQFAGCPDCYGMLFQQDVFAQLLTHLRKREAAEEIPHPLDPAELSVRRNCPACGQTMETHAYAGPGNSVIDTCFRCSVIWFDRGEFTRLVRAPGRR